MLLSVGFGGRRELGAILTVYLGTLLSGYSSGFSAVALPGMREEMGTNTNHTHSFLPPVQLTEEQLSWFGNYEDTTQSSPHPHCSLSASSLNIGQMAGCLIGGYSGGRFGPKRTILASCLPAALGWVIIASSPYFAGLVLGRVLCGLSSSFSSANCSLLVAQYR